MTDMFGAPSSMGLEWKSLFGKLLAIFPYGRETMTTQYGEAACVRADVYDLDAGVPVAMDALIFPRVLVQQTSSTEPGKAVVGRVGQGVARGGQNAPWILQDPTADDYARARDYFAAHPARAAIRYGGVSPAPAVATTAAPVYQQPAAQPGQPAQGAPPQPPSGPYGPSGASPAGPTRYTPPAGDEPPF